MVEEGDFPTTDDRIKDPDGQRVRDKFALSGLVEHLADLIGQFRNNLNLRSSAMHRVGITIGGAMFWVIAGLLLVVGILIGVDVAERADQRRQWDMTTATMQREWIRDTKVMNDHMDDLSRKYRMAELKYDELNLSLRRDGIAVPGDYRQGVSGNLDTDAFGKHRRHKRKEK